MKTVVYTLRGFSDADASLFQECAESPRGWLSSGFRFVSFDLTDADADADACAGMVESTSTGMTRFDGTAHVVRLQPRLPKPYCVVHLTSADDMGRLYPQTFLRGLSVTDRGQSPIRVHMNAANWARIPPDSEYTDLTDYRRHLILHEWGHVLGYDHASCTKQEAAADIMQQPSKRLGGCLPSPHVDGGSSAKIHAESIAAKTAKTSGSTRRSSALPQRNPATLTKRLRAEKA